MGMFKKKSKKKSSTSSGGATSSEGESFQSASLSASSSSGSVTGADSPKNDASRNKNINTSSSSTNSTSGTSSSSQKNTTAPIQTEPTMDMLPSLVRDLGSAADTSGEQAARALRTLFALSEHPTDDLNRELMVQSTTANLVPTLLTFLRRCTRSSSEQYLALLVLNNVSIPAENKRIIAIDCGGARMISRLLCEEPSCHLLAIILVNLTFADPDLRRELVSRQVNNELVDALAFSLWMACLTPEDDMTRIPAVTDDCDYSLRELLHIAMEDDKLYNRHDTTDNDAFENQPVFDPKRQLYPETARWCLCALKNLTRPSKDQTAAAALIDTNIVPLILRIITVGEGSGRHRKSDSSSNSTGTPVPSEPDFNPSDAATKIYAVENDISTEGTNFPSSWESNTIQDAALFTIKNLAATSSARRYLREEDAVHVLSSIADFVGPPCRTVDDCRQQLQQLQSLKARISLAYLVGAEGHFGQPRIRGSSYNSPPDGSVLLVSASEVEMLLELLANCMHHRGKEGPGGYSAATFTIKGVLKAIRCLLTNHLNQVTFFTVVGMRMNTLLLKAIALHCIQKALTVDSEAAEDASFSLYLLSNYGLKDYFLPKYFGRKSITEYGLLDKILTTYVRMENITTAGHHSADQILQRSIYLKYNGTIEDMVGADNEADYEFSPDLFSATDNIKITQITRRAPGVKPRKDIFNRPILRSRAPKKGNSSPWANRTAYSVFPSAIIAAQELSYGSMKVRHMDGIDDILIANNIASSANGDKNESYNYWWSWQDTAPEIQRNITRSNASQASYGQRSATSSEKDKIARREICETFGAMSIFGLNCNYLCGMK